MNRFPVLAFALCPAVLSAGEPTAAIPQDLMRKLAEETKVVAVMGLPGPASEFKADEDPDTLQVVFLDRKKDGPSRVTEDGEVIFLYKASDETQQKLIGIAFQRKAQRRLQGT